MSGPPGAGKSLLAACLPGILPPLQPVEALEVSMVASVAGELEGGRMTRRRPFRSPHHSASMPALVGGGLRVRPGEISLAHLGVLFLDELPEFQRGVLDSLRQPLETGNVSVARAKTHVTFPARVQLVAAMNPCRCGHLGDPALACSRAPGAPRIIRREYRALCSTASICMLMCKACPRPISRFRHQPKAAPQSRAGWPPRANCRQTGTMVRVCVRMPRPTAICWIASRRRMIRDASFSLMQQRRCDCRRAGSIGCLGSRGPWRTLRERIRSDGFMWRRRSVIGGRPLATRQEPRVIEI